MEAEGTIILTLVAAAQDQADGGLAHAGDELRDAQPRLDVSAYGVQQQKQAVHSLVLLQTGQQGHDVLVLGALGRLRQDLVAFHLAHDGQGVDVPPLIPADGGAEIHNPLAGLGGVLFLVFTAGRGCPGFFFHG